MGLMMFKKALITKLFIVFLLLIFSSFYVSASLNDANLKAYHRLNNATDLTGNGYSFTSGSGTFGTGFLGGSITFSGSQYQDTTSLPVSGDTTTSINVWIKPSSLPSTPEGSATCNVPNGYEIFALHTASASFKQKACLVTYGGQNYVCLDALKENVADNPLCNVTTVSTSTWTMITYVYNTTANTLKLYINGQLYNSRSTSGTGSGGTQNHWMLGRRQDNSGSYTSFFQGSISSLGVWNRIFTDDEILSLYNSGIGYDYPFASLIPDKIIFYNQSPSNLTAITAFTSSLNISYNFSLLNLSNPLLNYSIVGNPICAQFNNGSCDFLYNDSRFMSPSSNVTSGNYSLYSFVLGENSLYPIDKNLNDSFFNVSHSSFNLNTNNYLFSTEFLNISNTSQFNILEIMALSGSSPSRVYACNSSYDFNSNLLTNVNCQEIGNINGASYNHSHGSFSAHNLVPFTIFNGRVAGNGIIVTPQMFFVMRGANTGVSNVSYVATSSRTNLVRTSTTSGVNWASQTYTTDAHIHQYPSSSIYFSYQALGNYSNVENTSSVVNELIDIPSLNPQPPIITNPFGNNQTSRYLTITWINATNITFSPVVKYNLTLLNSDFSYNRTISTNAGNNSFTYDLFAQNLSIGVYYVKLFAYDSSGAFSSDEEFFNLLAETEVTIATKDSETGLGVSNFSFSVVRNDGYSFNGSTSNRTYLFGTLRNSFHNISIDASGYALFYANFSSGNSSNSTQNFTLYKTNSILITILNEATLSSLSGTLVNVSFIGLTTSNYNTTTGSLFVSNLTPDYYEIKLEATGFSTKSYFVTITDRTTQSLTALLTATFSGIGVYLKNAGDEPIIAGLITIQRFINSTYITIAQGQTDGIGYSLFQLENGVNYLWTISAPNYVPKQFLLKPYNANQPYIFKMVANVTSTSLSFNEFVSYYYSPTNQSLMNGTVDFSFTSMVKNSSFGSNSILWTALNCNGSWLNVSSPSGTTIMQSIDLSNRAGQTISCYYGLKVDGYSAFYFQNNYFVSGYALGNNTIIKASDDFKNDTPEAWQGIFAMFIIAISVLIAYEFSKEARDQNLIVSVAGFGTLIFLAFLGWVSIPMTALIVIEGVLLYFSNRGGN